MEFNRPVGRDGACRIFREWLDAMLEREPLPISWARVVERGPKTGRIHIHAVFAGIHRRIMNYVSAWEAEIGDVEIEEFDRDLGGLAYILKTVKVDKSAEAAAFWRKSPHDDYEIDFDLHTQHLRPEFRKR